MPELPEVENIVRGLRPLVEGRSLVGVQILNPAIVKAGLNEIELGVADQRVEKIERRGKFILFRFRSGHSLAFHLGMTGKLYFARPDEPLEKHTHLIFGVENLTRQLRHCDARRFGGAYFLNSHQAQRLERLDRLGPDPLEVDFKTFHRLFEGRRARMKALLLDQSVLSGVGNIYADEALHRAGIHPKQLAARVGREKLLRLYRHMGRILRHAIAEGGSSINDYVDAEGYRGRYQNYYRVYGRESEPCLARGCRGAVRRIIVGGRSTHFCPSCQRLRHLQRKRMD